MCLLQVLAACLSSFQALNYTPDPEFTARALQQLLSTPSTSAGAGVSYLGTIERSGPRPGTPDLIRLEQKVSACDSMQYTSIIAGYCTRLISCQVICLCLQLLGSVCHW